MSFELLIRGCVARWIDDNELLAQIYKCKQKKYLLKSPSTSRWAVFHIEFSITKLDGLAREIPCQKIKLKKDLKTNVKTRIELNT